MPATFLTLQERNAYEKIHLSDEMDILQYFFPTPDDKYFLQQFIGKTNCISILIQIGLIRLMGYLAPSWENQVSEKIVYFVAQQLYGEQTEIISLSEYTNWASLRTRHLQEILKYLQYRRWEPIMDEPAIEKWLLERGMEHDNERWLLDKLCQKLHYDKILRPAIGTLERIVGSIGELLNEETYQRLIFLLTPDLQEKLDKILELDKTLKMVTSPLLGLKLQQFPLWDLRVELVALLHEF